MAGRGQRHSFHRHRRGGCLCIDDRLRHFCCRDRQLELHRRLIDRDRLPLPAHARGRTQRALHPPSSLVLRGPPTSAGPSTFVLSFSGLPANLAGTQQISRGKTLRFRCDHVATTPPGPIGTGHRCRRPAHPPKGRLTALHSRSQPQRIYGFLQTRPHVSPPAQPAASRPPGQFRAAPLPLRCWIPPVRAPGQDFHLRSQRPCPAHLRSALSGHSLTARGRARLCSEEGLGGV